MRREIQPTRYSTVRTCDQITEKLRKDPLQVCNTTAAFDGLVMEFVPYDKPDAPVGALSEYHLHDGDTQFLIWADDGVVYVEYNKDGTFTVEGVTV